MPDSSPDGSPWCLLVEKYGAFLGKHSERLRISIKGQVQQERPLLGLEHVMVLAGGVSLSAETVRACAERGIPITFLSGAGRPYATLLSPELVGTVQTRRQQLLAYLDERGVALVGLDPSAGFLHEDRPGKPSLWKPRLKTIIQLQARHIATFVLGEGETEQPSVMDRWWRAEGESRSLETRMDQSRCASVSFCGAWLPLPLSF